VDKTEPPGLIKGVKQQPTDPGGSESLVYQAALPVSTQTVTMVADLIRGHRRAIGSRWRKASCGTQALLVLAVLRHDQRLADLAGGNGVSASTISRWVLEVLHLLTPRTPRLDRVLRKLRGTGATVVLLDGTLIRTRRRTGPHNRRHYSGKHKHHGLNVQALTDTDGNLLWLSPVLPGKTADITAARHHKLLARLHRAGLTVIADKGYQGFHKDLRATPDDQLALTPYKAEVNRPLTEAQKIANSVLNGTRCAVEGGFSTLKTWRILDKLRLHPRHAPTLLQALLTLIQHEHTTKRPLGTTTTP
jgi:hypothetical protein